MHQRRAGQATSDARKLKPARYALWKNPEDLTVNQQAKLAWIARTDPRLYRAYLLKEGLRHAFAVKGTEASTPWTAGWPGPNAAASRLSSSRPAHPQTPRRASTPPSNTACPTA